MMAQKKYFLSILVLGLMMLFISACSQTININPGGTGAAQSSLKPIDVLQKSADAMKKLKSAHVDLQSNTNIQGSGTSTTSGNTINLAVTGNGNEALPDQQLNLTVNKNTNIAEIVKGDKVYIQNTQGKWYVLDKSTVQNLVGNPFAGFNFDQNTLFGLIQHSKITDFGIQQLNGQNLRHLRADLDKEGVRQLLKNNPQLSNSFGQQNIDNVLNNTKSFASSLDVWIDETQFYVHRTQVKINLTADTSAISATATASSTPTSNVPTNVVIKFDSTVDLSKFNDPVTITPPADATPTNDPGTIIGYSS